MMFSQESKTVILSNFCPDDTIKRQNYIDSLNLGIQHHCAKFTHAFGGGIPSLHFIWRLPKDSSEEELVQRNTAVMDKLKGGLPVYHTRAMRKAAGWQLWSNMWGETCFHERAI